MTTLCPTDLQPDSTVHSDYSTSPVRKTDVHTTKQQTTSSRPTEVASAAQTSDHTRAWMFWRTQNNDRTRAFRTRRDHRAEWVGTKRAEHRQRQQFAHRARAFDTRDTTRTTWVVGTYR